METKKIKNKIIYFDSEDIYLDKKIKFIRDGYNDFSENYDEVLKNISNFESLINNLCINFKFTNTVLDLGCGTGSFGKEILKYNNKINIIGIDLSEKMANIAIQNGYNEIYIGLMEKIIYKLDMKFDNIISLSALYFLPNDIFKDVIKNIFKIAKRSITLGIDEITDIYNKNIESIGYKHMRGYNNIPIIESLNIPDNWKITYKQKVFMWKSPKTNDKIYGIIIRYEYCE